MIYCWVILLLLCCHVFSPFHSFNTETFENCNSFFIFLSPDWLKVVLVETLQFHQPSKYNPTLLNSADDKAALSKAQNIGWNTFSLI